MQFRKNGRKVVVIRSSYDESKKRSVQRFAGELKGNEIIWKAGEAEISEEEKVQLADYLAARTERNFVNHVGSVLFGVRFATELVADHSNLHIDEKLVEIEAEVKKLQAAIVERRLAKAANLKKQADELRAAAKAAKAEAKPKREPSAGAKRGPKPKAAPAVVETVVAPVQTQIPAQSALSPVALIDAPPPMEDAFAEQAVGKATRNLSKFQAAHRK